MLLCRAARSLRLISAKHVPLAPRLLSAERKAPDKFEPPCSAKDRSSQNGDSSSSSSSSRHCSSARRVSPGVTSPAEWAAIGKSQALTARIGELGRQGPWQDVIRALQTAESNQELHANNFNAAIAALIRSRQPERALQLLPLMQQRGIEPTVVTCNSLIDANSKSGQW
jgi:pentatricopeptide repeat protein